jgi:hypothetical protein
MDLLTQAPEVIEARLTFDVAGFANNPQSGHPAAGFSACGYALANTLP